MGKVAPAPASQHSLYRGIHAGHPAMAYALNGICHPGDPLGVISPQRHNDGGAQPFSPFTSWTTVRAIAVIFANRLGPGGVMLMAAAGASPDPAIWHWGAQFAADDDWWENEVLLWGVRDGLEVVRL